jgi:hypothetical protein
MLFSGLATCLVEKLTLRSPFGFGEAAATAKCEKLLGEGRWGE